MKLAKSIEKVIVSINENIFFFISGFRFDVWTYHLEEDRVCPVGMMVLFFSGTPVMVL